MSYAVRSGLWRKWRLPGTVNSCYPLKPWSSKFLKLFPFCPICLTFLSISSASPPAIWVPHAEWCKWNCLYPCEIFFTLTLSSIFGYEYIFLPSLPRLSCFSRLHRLQDIRQMIWRTGYRQNLSRDLSAQPSLSHSISLGVMVVGALGM